MVNNCGEQFMVKGIGSLRILFVVIIILAAIAANGKEYRKIYADFNSVRNLKSETYFKCIGAGRAAEGLRADWQEQLRMIQTECPFEYIRFHGLFHDDMGVCKVIETKGKRKLLLNFQYIDVLFDFLLSVNIRPFVELSFMPSDMSSNDKTLFWWKAHPTPPLHYEEWEYLVHEFVKHITERYGVDEIRKWYFEVWNEPNHPSFFTGTQDDYFKIYATSVKAIKQVDEKYRVGGPATAGNSWINEFLDKCLLSDIPFDFVSTHTYAVGRVFDEFGTKRNTLLPEPLIIPERVKNVRKTIDSYKLDKPVELHYTEWNSSSSPKDLVHDTYLNAAYVLNVLRHVDGAAQSMSYWTFTDIFEEAGPPFSPLHGGFGLLTLQGYRKPSFYSFSYLSQLGKYELVSSDKDSWVCKNEAGEVQILAYDLTLPVFPKGEHNNSLFAKERIPENKDSLKIELENIPNGEYRLEVYRTGYMDNDIQSAYIRMGAPKQLNSSQLETLELYSMDIPQTLYLCEIIDGKFECVLPMRDNDVYFVKLVPLYKKK